jgi:hypothetical protein
VLLNPGGTNIKKGTQVLVIAREQRNAEILGFYRKSSTCNNPAMKASSRSPSIAEEKSGDGRSFGNTNPMVDTDGRMVEMVVVDKFHDVKEATGATHTHTHRKALFPPNIVVCTHIEGDEEEGTQIRRGKLV